MVGGFETLINTQMTNDRAAGLLSWLKVHDDGIILENTCWYEGVDQDLKDAIEQAINALDSIDKIREEISECLKAIENIKTFPVQLYSANEIAARKVTYEQCLGFIDKYTKGNTENAML